MSESAPKNIIVWFALFGAMPFLSFHAFLFALYYYRSAIEIPLLLFLPVVWLCNLRVMSYAPSIPMFLRVSPFAKCDAVSIRAPVEAILWYIVLASVYLHFAARFDFPRSLDQLGVLPTIGIIGLGYFTFFVGSFFGSLAIGRISTGLSGMMSQVWRMRELANRLISTFFAYLGIMLLFAGVYRLVSYHSPKVFDRPIESTVDAIYFSTITITTLGYGDIRPTEPLTKVITAIEALIGIFLLAILIGLSIGLSLESAKAQRSGGGDAENGAPHP